LQAPECSPPLPDDLETQIDVPNAAEAVGRMADAPWQIPWAGWLDVLSRVIDQIDRDRVSMTAASVAFYATLALFPALIATFSVYALLADPAALATQLSELSVALPWSVRSLIASEVADLAKSTGRLSVGLVISLFFSFFAASSGMVALIDSVNVAYSERETRGFLIVRWLAIRFAVGVSLFVCLAVASLTILPALSHHIGVGDHVHTLVAALRWPGLGLWVMVGLALLYRYGPNRTPPKFRWVVCGAGVATLIWLAASFGLSVYVGHFADYNKTYGTLGAVVVLSLWFYVSSFAIILGAELNAELEHQTTLDTTVGPDKPMGMRHATMADTLGESTPTRPFWTIVKSFFHSLRTPRRDKVANSSKPRPTS
jgi:membrane protein